MEFKELYDKAFSVSFESIKTHVCEIGSVGCAIEDENGNVYLGKNLDMSCSLGMCAERNAISTKLSVDTSKIKKMVVVHKSGKIMVPCGACREFMFQLGDICKDLEILVSLNPLKTTKLDDLLPSWRKDELNK